MKRPRRVKSTKASKGLRHFSMKVCNKVEEKGKTTYNEVADELVLEFTAQQRVETKMAEKSGAAKPKVCFFYERAPGFLSLGKIPEGSHSLTLLV